jgi:Icc-related predicted phosphoesterase
MKIFAISDIHGETKHFEAAAGQLTSADVVVVSGDIGKSGDARSAEEILSYIERHTMNIVAVHGNWDREEVRGLLERKGYSIHARGVNIGGIGFFGAGGSTQTPMNTPSEYQDEEINDFLSTGFKSVDGAAKKVCITHAPPYRVCDRTFIGLHGGSRAIRDFISEKRIDLCLAGNIHEAHGIDRMNDCIVVNSGSFKKGRYSVVEINDGINISQGKL